MAAISLFDIPWEQVLCKHFLPYFSLKELFQLRGISPEFRDLIDCHFSLAFTINTSQYHASFSRVAFDVLTRRNGCLKELVLCNARDWLSDDSLICVLQNNPSLQKIILSNCLGISNTSLYTIGAFCRQVCFLSLRSCVWVTGSGLISLISNNLPLEHVDLCGCWDLCDEDVINLVMQCRGIKYLLLNNIYGLTNHAVSVIAQLCPGLVQLSVQGCWRLTDQAIMYLVNFCPELRALQVRECQKVTELSLAKLRARKVRIDKAPPPLGGLPWERMQDRPVNIPL
ncbi:uncharacterized protein LOC143292903 [Babylonia areolata]|uniref:uncharacterized protein LOC143292903 n=1 Tax=Babylonia areolata TaxID=304850 RepID=UPI003FD1DD03